MLKRRIKAGFVTNPAESSRGNLEVSIGSRTRSFRSKVRSRVIVSTTDSQPISMFVLPLIHTILRGCQIKWWIWTFVVLLFLDCNKIYSCDSFLTWFLYTLTASPVRLGASESNLRGLCLVPGAFAWLFTLVIRYVSTDTIALHHISSFLYTDKVTKKTKGLFSLTS